MAVQCNQQCGKCRDETCISYQVNQRIEAQIHWDNHHEIRRKNNGRLFEVVY